MKAIIGTIILLGLATAIPACLICVPCSDGGHVCTGAPSPPCICLPEGNCAIYECPDGDIGGACCSLFLNSPVRKGKIGQVNHDWTDKWLITFNDGSQMTLVKHDPPASFDPLSPFTEDKIEVKDKDGNKLIAVSYDKHEKLN